MTNISIVLQTKDCSSKTFCATHQVLTLATSINADQNLKKKKIKREKKKDEDADQTMPPKSYLEMIFKHLGTKCIDDKTVFYPHGNLTVRQI